MYWFTPVYSDPTFVGDRAFKSLTRWLVGPEYPERPEMRQLPDRAAFTMGFEWKGKARSKRRGPSELTWRFEWPTELSVEELASALVDVVRARPLMTERQKRFEDFRLRVDGPQAIAYSPLWVYSRTSNGPHHQTLPNVGFTLHDLPRNSEIATLSVTLGGVSLTWLRNDMQNVRLAGGAPTIPVIVAEGIVSSRPKPPLDVTMGAAIDFIGKTRTPDVVLDDVSAEARRILPGLVSIASDTFSYRNTPDSPFVAATFLP